MQPSKLGGVSCEYKKIFVHIIDKGCTVSYPYWCLNRYWGCGIGMPINAQALLNTRVLKSKEGTNSW